MMVALICVLKLLFAFAIAVGIANLFAWLIVKLFPLLMDLLVWVAVLIIVVALSLTILFLAL